MKSNKPLLIVLLLTPNLSIHKSIITINNKLISITKLKNIKLWSYPNLLRILISRNPLNKWKRIMMLFKIKSLKLSCISNIWRGRGSMSLKITCPILSITMYLNYPKRLIVGSIDRIVLKVDKIKIILTIMHKIKLMASLNSYLIPHHQTLIPCHLFI